MTDTQTQIAELKRKLTEELNKEDSDNSVVLSLSHEIAKLDSENVRFSVDAGIINRLGKELVGRHETAVSELVKNAYDADATEVKLIFKNAWQPGGSLEIIDNGVGMTRNQLIDGFMRLSSSDKIHNPKSPNFNRTRAGRKGIGRFATQRLGNKLTIITQTLSSEVALRVIVDWNQFQTDIDLSSIANSIEVIPKEIQEGTTLIIENLREGWSDPMIKRVYRYTSDLLQPFPLSKRRKEEQKHQSDPGFKSSYFRESESEENKIIDEQEAFLKHALAEIQGYVLDNGQGCWTLKSEKLDFPETVFDIGSDEKDDNSKFQYLKDVHFQCSYFIYDESLLSKQLKTFIQGVGLEKGGLRLYRNGFRVLPYAEKGNDWLGLDASVRRRNVLPPHANNSFFGFVEVSDNAGIRYEETSSREGLIENEAFKELADFVYRSIIGAVLKVAELRGRKGKTGQKDFKKDDDPTEVVDNAINAIREVFDTLKNNKDSKIEDLYSEIERFNNAFISLTEGRYKEKIQKQALIDEINMLRILAGLGLVIGEFVHEVKRFLPGFNTDMTYLKNNIPNNESAINRLLRLENNLKAFTAYTSYFDKAISRNVLRELEPIELRDAVNDFRDTIKADLDRSGITLHKPIFEGFDLYTIPMHPSEWASILFNFYTNSKKAIRRKGEKGQLQIRCGSENNILFLEFSDNGDGIPKIHEEEVFNAFYTTSSASGHSSSDMESMTGTGLGLKIVRDIVESYSGEVYVAVPENNYSTTIRVEIPKDNNEEHE